MAHMTGDLQEQRRFSDARIATDEHHHAGQHAPPKDMVEFRKAGRQPFSLIGADLRNGYRLECQLVVAALCPLPSGRRPLFYKATPLFTLRAAPEPLAALISTALANIYGANLTGHPLSPDRRKA